MSVIINALLLTGNYSGIQHSIESYLLSLKKLDYNNIKIIVPNEYSGVLSDESYELIRPAFKFKNRIQRIVWENTTLPVYLKKTNAIYHAPGQVLPIICPQKSVITIHDTVSILYPNLCQNETVAMYYRYMLPRSIYKADKIIAVSETVKKNIIDLYKVGENKIEVIYHGIRPGFKKERCTQRILEVMHAYDLPDKYILFVGNIEPRKNIPILFKAFAELKRNMDFDYKLVIAGKKGWKYAPVFEEIDRLKIEDSVQFLGYVNEPDLPIVYSQADVFVMPSIYEGFGLPVLEALSCGVPTIISNGGALPEIAKDSAICVKYNDHKALARSIYDLLSDKDMRKKYISKGYSRVNSFKWERQARKSIELYTSVLKNV